MLYLRITDKDLPTLPIVATQALELINKDKVTNQEIEELIRMDPSLTQRLLTTANSPFYAGRYPIKSISDSIARMGLRQLRNLILIAATGELFNGDDPMLQKLWKHSIAVAIASHKLAGLVAGVDAEEAFIGGMMHDVGKVVIFRHFSELYRDLVKDARDSGTRCYVLEEKRFVTFTHMSVGGMVIKKWKLSDQLADAAAFHHSVETAPVPTTQFGKFVSVISLASLIVNNMGIGVFGPENEGDDYARLEVDGTHCLAETGFSAEKIEALVPEIQAHYEAQINAFA